MRPHILNAILTLSILAGGCASSDSKTPSTTLDMQRTELYFGQDTNVGGNVTDEQWLGFVDHEITPRFPAGVTILNADGQWSDPKGVLVREDSRVIILLHNSTHANERKVEEIRHAYVTQFSQDAVMRVDSAAKVRF